MNTSPLRQMHSSHLAFCASRRLLPLLSLGLVLCASSRAQAADVPANAQLEQKLNFFWLLGDFSRAKPLNQRRLMRWVLKLGKAGIIPESYRGHDAFPQADAYAPRTSVRRFVRDLVGQDLTMWQNLEDSDNVFPKLVGDKLGWIYNTGNTMYANPKVSVTSRRIGRGASMLTARFRVFHRIGNLSNEPPNTLVGSGTATFARRGKNWIVTSWRMTPNPRWENAADRI